MAGRYFHGCYELVAPSRKRLDEGGIVGGIAKRFAQPFNGGIQSSLEINKRILVPQSRAQLFPAYHFARVFQQLEEYLAGLLLKFQFHPLLAKLRGSQIKLKYAEAIDGTVLGRHNHT